MPALCSPLQPLWAAVLSVFTGAELAAGCLLVPYRQSVKPAELARSARWHWVRTALVWVVFATILSGL